MVSRVPRAAWIGAVVVAVSLPWAYVVWTIHQAGSDAPTDAARPNAVVWAGRVFASEADLGRWLRSRGASYKAWRAAHPGGAAVLGHRPALPARQPPPHVTPRGRPWHAAAGDLAVSLLRLLFEVLVVLLVVALIGLALAPERLFLRLRPESTNGSAELRVASFAVALSIGTGVLVAHFLG